MGEILAEALRIPRSNAPLRLFGAVHYLALAGRAPAYAGLEDPWPAFREILTEHRDWLRGFVSEQPVQTNEVQRSWTLVPGLLAAARGAEAVDLVELGPSAGLNLVCDRYGYRYEQGNWGAPDSELVLRGQERRPVPGELLSAPLPARRRVGIDERPIDIASEHGARLLQAFVWPDQTERLARARRAIEIARREPPELIQGDFVAGLAPLLAERDDDALMIVFHSYATEYLVDERYAELESLIGRAGDDGPLAWVSIEIPRQHDAVGYVLEVQRWPGGRRERLADVHYHGVSLEWLGAP